MDEGTVARRRLNLVNVTLLRDLSLHNRLVKRPFVTIATSLLLRTPVPTAVETVMSCLGPRTTINEMIRE
jgi:hypothetical protein